MARLLVRNRIHTCSHKRALHSLERTLYSSKWSAACEEYKTYPFPQKSPTFSSKRPMFPQKMRMEMARLPVRNRMHTHSHKRALDSRKRGLYSFKGCVWRWCACLWEIEYIPTSTKEPYILAKQAYIFSNDVLLAKNRIHTCSHTIALHSRKGGLSSLKSDLKKSTIYTCV